MLRLLAKVVRDLVFSWSFLEVWQEGYIAIASHHAVVERSAELPCPRADHVVSPLSPHPQKETRPQRTRCGLVSFGRLFGLRRVSAKYLHTAKRTSDAKMETLIPWRHLCHGSHLWLPRTASCFLSRLSSMGLEATG